MFKSDRIIALSVGASKIVLAEFSIVKSSGPELRNYGIGRLEIDPEHETDESPFIVTAIRDVMKRCGIKPAPLFMTVSGQAVFPRYVKLPPVSRDKIDQIIQYEAEQNVPFPINEVVWDYELIETEENDLSVMLVAVKIENVKRLTDCVIALGLEPEIVDVAPMALYNTVRYNYSDLKGCTMILDIGARSSNLIFIEGSRIFSRSIPVAGNAITNELAKEFDLSFAEAEEIKLTHGFVAFGGVYAGPDSQVADRVSKIVRNVITRLHAEVNRSINFYRSQQGGSMPSLVLLTGGSSIIPHSDTFFKEKLKVDVEYLNPFANVVVSDQIDTTKIASDLQLMGEVVGLALRRALTCPIEINLMPPDIVAKKVFKRRQPYFALAGVGIVLIMLCWWVYCQRIRAMLTKQSSNIEKKTESLAIIQEHLNRANEDITNITDRINIITDVISLRTAWIEMLESIHSCMPDGMWITSVKPMLRGTEIVEIELELSWFEDKLKKASSSRATAIEMFRDKLRESSHFVGEGTSIKKAIPPLPGAYAHDFIIGAALKKPIDVGVILTEKKDK